MRRPEVFGDDASHPRGGPANAQKTSTLGHFVLVTLVVLPLAFAGWYLAAPLLLAPVVWLTRAAVRLGVPDLVRSVEQSGAIVTFVTTLKPAGVAAAGVVTVDVNLLLYSFGLPLLFALTIAAHEPAWKRHVVAGYVALLAPISVGVVADFLKNIAITAGPAVASQTGFVGWQREVIAFAFQFGSLILPAVAPAVAWVAMHGRFVRDLRQRAPVSTRDA